MRVLVTGGAGFIGSHLAERLLTDGNNVVVVDNLSTGSLENIESFKNKAEFNFVEGDICDAKLMETLGEQSEMVYHLAAAVGVKLIADRPVHTIETNISGTEVVLDAANKFNKSVFIASSSEVYGKSEAVPFQEDDDIVLGSTRVPRWSYACSKAIDEFLALAFYKQYGLRVVIGRFFNTVGPKQTGQYGMVVPRFVQWALNGEPVSIYGTGQQKRCFCYVGDVVDAVIGLMNCEQAPLEIPGRTKTLPATSSGKEGKFLTGQAAGNVYNIGSTEEISIEGLADKIIKMTGSKSKKEFVPYEEAYGMPMEDMMQRVPSLERIQKTIGWEPKTSLTETLQVIIQSEKLRMKNVK